MKVIIGYSLTNWLHSFTMYFIFFQVFAKIISADHEVFLQVWRPHPYHVRTYTLIDETYFHPTELRFQEVPLERHTYIQIQKKDILGLYFPKKNPIAWSQVPCSSLEQQYLYVENPPDIQVGQTITFSEPKDPNQGCRHYSFTAILGEYRNIHSHDEFTNENG